MVLKIDKKLVIIFLFYLNIIPVFGLWWGDRPETGLVQYGKNIDKDRLELLEDKQLIHFIGQNKENIVIGRYTIRNNDAEYKTTLGILFQEWGGYPDPEKLNLQFFINNNKINYYKIYNQWSVNMGEEKIELPQSSTCWTLIDVIFPKNSVVIIEVKHKEIYSSYNSPYLEYFPGLLYWKGPTKFSVEIINEYISSNNVENYWVSDIVFTSKTSDYKGWVELNMNEYLQTLKDMETSIIKVLRKNENIFLVEFKEDFYKNYHRSIMIERRYWDSGPDGYIYVNGKDEIYLEPLFKDSLERNNNITKRLLGQYELIFLTKNQLRIMRNVFYARHGYIFKEKNIQAMFERKFWWKNPNFNESMLTDIDRVNIETIQKLEKLDENSKE